MLGVPESRWTCVEHSTTKPRQGIFMGEHGTSEMRMVDKVYDDSVRSVFRAADRPEASQTGAKQPQADEKEEFYTPREFNYYASGDEGEAGDGERLVKKLDS